MPRRRPTALALGNNEEAPPNVEKPNETSTIPAPKESPCNAAQSDRVRKERSTPRDSPRETNTDRSQKSEKKLSARATQPIIIPRKESRTERDSKEGGESPRAQRKPPPMGLHLACTTHSLSTHSSQTFSPPSICAFFCARSRCANRLDRHVSPVHLRSAKQTFLDE